MNLKRMTFCSDDSTIIIEQVEKHNKVTVMDDGKEPYVRYISLNNKGVKRLMKTRGVMMIVG